MITNNLTNDQYRQERGISKSSLDYFDKSPAHYLSSLSIKREETAAMAMGTAIHTAVLEPDTFSDRYVIAPENIDRRTKDGKAQWAELESSGKLILSAPDAEKVLKIGRAHV